MKLRMICEWGGSKEEFNDLLAKIDPSLIIDSPMFGWHVPFIYIQNDTKQLYVGPRGSYHTDIFSQAEGEAYEESRLSPEELEFMASKDEDHAKLIKNYERGIITGSELDSRLGVSRGGNVIEKAYYGSADVGPYAVGRVGKNMKKILQPSGYGYQPVSGMENLEVVSFYESKTHTNSIVPCVEKLLETRVISPHAVVVYAGQVLPVSDGETQQPEFQQATDEQMRKSMLQVAVHLGAWPDGRRMTMAEKSAAQRELGMRSWEMKKNPWQKAMEQHGLASPGQRWWAPTSEGVSKSPKTTQSGTPRS